MKKLLYIIILFVPLISKINAQKKLPLIGAYYFDGWAGKNNNTTEKWAQNAPTNATKKLIINFQNRKPIWGWRDDKLSIMEKQINLASKNAIDFFSFCWYWSNNNGDIDTTQILKQPLHTGIELFKKAKNKRKMKYALLIANHQGAIIKDGTMWCKAVEFWAKHYFNDPQYLKIDGKPVITIFGSKSANPFIPEMRKKIRQCSPFKALYIISNGFNDKNSNYDMLSWYNIREAESGKRSIRNYSSFSKFIQYEWTTVPQSTTMAPCVMTNWDMRPWENKTEGIYYINRTPLLFKNQVKAALNFINQRHSSNKVIMIYAWNELGEGGYLVPTKEDPKGKYLKMIKEAKRETLK